MAEHDADNSYASVDPEHLTWAVLLAKWTEFARSAVGLPDHGEGGRVRESVADIITLQAVWFALSEADALDEQQRVLAIDRASVLIARHREAIARRWGADLWPDELRELVDEAEARLHDVRGS